jgi:hypothetical protein
MSSPSWSLHDCAKAALEDWFAYIVMRNVPLGRNV